MRFALLGCCVMVWLAGGCAPSFCGEWLEDGVRGDNGVLTDASGRRRAAMQFDPISTVRYGAFSEEAGVVDAQTVMSDSYFLFDGGRSAQAGGIIARLEGDRLTAWAGGVERHFSRVKGKSIFPPHVKLPQWSAQADQASPDRYASAAP